MTIWASRKADIQRMIDDEMTDVEIGIVYGVKGDRMCVIRKKLGIT